MPAIAEFAVDRFFAVSEALTPHRVEGSQDSLRTEHSLFPGGITGVNRAGHAARVLLVGVTTLYQHLRRQLVAPQWELREAQSGSEALELLWQEPFDLLLFTPVLPDLEPAEFQGLVQAQFPSVQVISLEKQGGQAQSITADFQERARDDRQPSIIGDDRSRMQQSEPEHKRSVAAGGDDWQGLLGGAPAMQRVYHAARLVARRDTTVLIQGESGTGKDLLARAIHNASPRKKQPFVVINCAAIPETLLEAELFGYTKGAFTGASQSRIGRVHAADGGTLFLDEIGDMPLPLQSKILRFLEQGEVQRIGDTDTLKVNCRVIAATNVDLMKQVKANGFREDLYYRLAILPVRLPPLRERMEDLDILCASFLDRFCPGSTLHPAARQLLLEHNWPGNVRELRNVMERASLFADTRPEILPEDIFL